MIKTPIDMRLFTQDLTSSVWTLGAIGALLESGLVELMREPRSLEELTTLCPTFSKGLIERCLASAAAAGVVTVNNGCYLLVEGAAPFSNQPFRSALQGDIRSTLIQSLLLLDAAAGKSSGAGWQYTDPVLLQAQGNSSALFPPMFKMNIAPGPGRPCRASRRSWSAIPRHRRWRCSFRNCNVPNLASTFRGWRRSVRRSACHRAREHQTGKSRQ